MNHPRPFAAWVLAALLVAPLPVAAEPVDVRALAGLPRAGLADGQAIAWRNVGVVAESEWLDAEVNIASCLPTIPTPPTPADRPGSACAAAPGGSAGGNLGQQFALTFKVPRWSEGAPLVDLALRGGRALSPVGTSGDRSGGSSGELTVTQPLGALDAFAGFSTSVRLTPAAGRSRSAFAGVTWYATQRTRLEFVAERAADQAPATIDRTLTLRILHATPGKFRVAAWTTRALDDPASPWRVGAGCEFAF